MRTSSPTSSPTLAPTSAPTAAPTCARGFARASGGGCADVNECASRPCRHNATCTDSSTASAVPHGSFRCACKPGYADGACAYTMAPALRAVSGLGRLCSALHSRSTKAKNGTCGLDVDECLSKPCANGATCTAGRDAYTCNCTAGYSGKQCDVDIDDCAPRPCHNGGQCLDAVGPSRPRTLFVLYRSVQHAHSTPQVPFRVALSLR